MFRRDFFSKLTLAGLAGVAETGSRAFTRTVRKNYQAERFTCKGCAYGLEMKLRSQDGIQLAFATYPECKVVVEFRRYPGHRRADQACCRRAGLQIGRLSLESNASNYLRIRIGRSSDRGCSPRRFRDGGGGSKRYRRNSRRVRRSAPVRDLPRLCGRRLVQPLGACRGAEEEMLTVTAAPRKPNSRLSCQIPVTKALDGLVVHLPPFQK